MRCIIVDDESTARTIIEQLCNNHGGLEIAGSFPNAMEAIKFLNKESVDLIFLDIHMPGFSGFDFIETLSNPPKIIITSSDRNFALDAFEFASIVDYLVKPIAPERFAKAIEKAQQAQAPKSEFKSSELTDLYVNIDRRLVKIAFDEIYLIEAKGDYINIKTDSKAHLVHATLKKIEDKLPTDRFLKVHRSFIINIHRIVDIEDNSVLIKQDIIPVSRANRAELMRRLNLL